jgi:hypothetical protein
VFTPQAAAGDLWFPDDTRAPLAEVVIPDNNLIRLCPQPALPAQADPHHGRQALLFGDRGQETLTRMRVAVVGLRARLETPVYQSPVRARRRDMVMIMAMWTMASWCWGRVS